jgi:hypothetical protein
VNFRAVELRSILVQSLKNTQTARKKHLPLTTNLSTADAMDFQIKLREIFLNEIRVIRTRFGTRFRSIDVVADDAVSDQRTKDALRALVRKYSGR